MTQSIHMVCLCSPWPADTGGARDMLERLKALHQHGIRVHLHYFIRKHEHPAEELNTFCSRISVYRRNSPWSGMLNGWPYIIACRQYKALCNNHNADKDPILFDGIHTTAFINQLHQNNRKLVIRMHNDEVRYYSSLIRFERNVFKRLYFRWESIRLHHWMKRVPNDIPLGCVQTNEQEVLKNKYGFTRTFLLPPPVPSSVNIATGTGGYCLYHGNLSVGENERAAIWLLRRVFAQIKLPLVIAGKSPSKKLEKLVHFYQHACLVGNPTQSELQDLIRKAQINVLPSLTDTGIKQKIFDALQHGRHCLINSNMQVGSPWTDSCYVASDPAEMGELVQELFNTPFTEKMIQDRAERLQYWRNELNPIDELIKQLS